MYERFVERRAEEALADTPVVLIVGPRRAGETTLVRKMGEAGRNYITLDDQTTLDAAQSDPVGFIRGLDQAIIDEIQRAPDLLLAIKKTVDEDYRPGRFLLTGSANILTLPRVADSLAGRMETIQMLPLARAEVMGKTPRFLERLFDGKLKNNQAAVVGDDLTKLVLIGGFPEAISRDSERRSHGWARSYLTSVLTRDLRGDRRHREADGTTEVRPPPSRAFGAIDQLLAIRRQHQRQPQDRTALRRSARTGIPRCDIAALVYERAETDRQDAETAFSRLRCPRHNARTELRSCEGRYDGGTFSTQCRGE
jgi:hypothetical protein